MKYLIRPYMYPVTLKCTLGLAACLLFYAASAVGSASMSFDAASRIAAVRMELEGTSSAQEKLAYVRGAYRAAAEPDMRAAIALLWAKHLPDSLPLLTQLVFEQEPATIPRLELVHLLADIGTVESAQPLMRWLSANSSIEESFGVTQDQQDTIQVITRSIVALVRISDREAEAVKGTLKTLGDIQTRHATIKAFRDLALSALTGENKYLAELTQACESDDALIRRKAALHLRFLGKMERHTAPAQLVLLLKDPQPTVKRAASLALFTIRDPATVDALLTTAADEEIDLATRANCIAGLGAMPEAANREDVLEMLKSLSGHPRLGTGASLAIVRIKGED